MVQKIWRLYLDTSVIGGCFDAKFSEDSRRVIDAILIGRATLLFSEVLEAELMNAPEQVRRLFANIPDSVCERIAFSSEIEALAKEYIAQQV
jgi:hypothetical protein